MSTIYIKKGTSFVEAAELYQKTGNTWTQITNEQFIIACFGDIVPVFGGIIPSVYVFEVAAPNTLTAETCQCEALLNGRVLTTGVTWSVVSGGTYATIDQTGLLAIDSGAEADEVIIQADYSTFSGTHNITVTYKSGSTSETTSETTVDASGNTTTTTTTVTENEDGTSNVETIVVITDGSGNTIGTREGMQNNNADGSYDSTITTYNENGDPTETTNASGDTAGNVSTQEVEYDESGNSAVTGYVIDTSGNPDGEKTFNGDGVNTEYYAFDITHGFVLNIHFTINYRQQPAGQDQNHHQILAMKRADPSPWYGFQLRQSSTNAYIQLGTQFATGNNTNTPICGETTTSANTEEYDLTITYNPTANTNCFVCYNNLKHANVYTSNYKFPDIDDLKYLKVTIGYAMDPNGDPYRYSNINVLDFSITRM